MLARVLSAFNHLDLVRSGGLLADRFPAEAPRPSREPAGPPGPLERHLSRFVGRSPVVVEVGAFSGGDPRRWLDYFGDGTTLYGVDERGGPVEGWPGFRPLLPGEGRLDAAFWTKHLSGRAFDLVIDDGGVEAYWRIVALEQTLPRLAPGGVYVCAGGDVAPVATLAGGLADRLHGEGSAPSAVQSWVHSVHLYPRLVVVEKHAAPAPRVPCL